MITESTRPATAPPGDTSTAFAPASRDWRLWIQTQWPRVRIVSIDISEGGARAPSDARIVHTCVHLGSLAPADVRVEMTSGDPAVANDPSAAAVRLWSVQSYGNGSFVFEAELPRAALAGVSSFSIRVVPSSQHGPLSLPPVVRRVRAAAEGAPDDRPADLVVSRDVSSDL